MKPNAYGVIQAFFIALALCGCATLETRSKSRSLGAVQSAPPTNTIRESKIENKSDTKPILEDVNAGLPNRVLSTDKLIKLNLHIFGLSYHPDREGARLSHLDNEVNFGLGIGYQLHNDTHGITRTEAGFFKDSGSEWARFAGVGYLFKLNDRWRLGADLLAVQSPTYNKGNAFIAPLPNLVYDFGAARINATYIPRIPQFNELSVFAIYMTVPIWKW